ncbi:MAG TPA: adenylate/guanylate cyclase domain-containing protein [Methylotenera sp.]
MITSKYLLEQSGLSRATLNNYISLGLLPKPIVKRIATGPGASLTTLGYFPDWAIDRIQLIKSLKKQGLSMDAICQQVPPDNNADSSSGDNATLNNNEYTTDSLADHKNASLEKGHDMMNNASTKISSQESLNVSIDSIPYPAYMINYECGLVWLNAAAQQSFFMDASIPDRAEDRSIIPRLLEWAKDLSEADKETLFKSHFNVVKHRLSKDTLSRTLLSLPQDQRLWLENCYDLSEPSKNTLVQDSTLYYPTNVNKRIISISFREGVLFTYVPKEADANQLLEWLSHRDSVIRTLLSQRLPVLTPVAAMVADLQNSVRICSELPPDEYFQLINEIWSTLDPIFREYYGAYGKHTGDGMVYYFFPQPDNNYIMNAILCACKIRESMRIISHNWALKKGWTNQLFMNIGLNEGEEWLGTFKTNTSYELVVLGETINICSRLSDFAQYGEVWSTKNLVSKLTHAERNLIDYGVTRKALEQEIFVSNSYAQISTLIDKDNLRHIKLIDISSTAVTQIRAVK